MIGEDSLHSSNQIMTKRLSNEVILKFMIFLRLLGQKFGIPVMLSFNYPINDFEEDMERMEIFKWIVTILEEKNIKKVK